MTDIATFGFAIDSSQVKEAASNLRDMAAASVASQKGTQDLLSVVKQQQLATEKMIQQQQALIQLHHAQATAQDQATTGWRANLAAIGSAVTAASTATLAFKGLSSGVSDAGNATKTHAQHIADLTDKTRQLTEATVQAAAAQTQVYGGPSSLNVGFNRAVGGFANYISPNAPPNILEAVARFLVPAYDVAGQVYRGASRVVGNYQFADSVDTEQYAKDVRATVGPARDLAFRAGTSPEAAAQFRALNGQVGLDDQTSAGLFERLSGTLNGFDDASVKARREIAQLGVSLKGLGTDDAGGVLQRIAQRVKELPDGLTKTRTAIDLLGTSDRTVINRLANPNAYSLPGEIENARRQVSLDGQLQNLQNTRDTRATLQFTSSRQQSVNQDQLKQAQLQNDIYDSHSAELFQDSNIGYGDRIDDYISASLSEVFNKIKYALDPGRDYSSYSFATDPATAAYRRRYGSPSMQIPSPELDGGVGYLYTQDASTPKDDAFTKYFNDLQVADRKTNTKNAATIGSKIQQFTDSLVPGNQAILDALSARAGLEQHLQGMTDSLGNIPGYGLSASDIRELQGQITLATRPSVRPQAFQGDVAGSRASSLTGLQGFQRDLAERRISYQLSNGGGFYRNYQIPGGEDQGIQDQLIYGRQLSADLGAIGAQNSLDSTNAGLDRALAGGNQYDVQESQINEEYRQRKQNAGSSGEVGRLEQERIARISQLRSGQSSGNAVQRNYQGVLSRGTDALRGAGFQGPVALRNTLLRSQGAASASAGGNDDSGLQIHMAASQSLGQGSLQYFNTEADIDSQKRLSDATKGTTDAFLKQKAEEVALAQLRAGLIEQTDLGKVSTQAYAKSISDLTLQTAQQTKELRDQQQFVGADQSAALQGPGALSRQRLEDSIALHNQNNPGNPTGNADYADAQRKSFSQNVTLTGDAQVASGDQNLQYLQRQIELEGQIPAIRQKDLDLLKEQQQLQNSGITQDDPNYSRLMNLTSAQSDANNQLQQFQKNQQVADQAAQGVADNIGKMILQVNHARQAASGLFQDMAQGLLQLSLLNPLQNLLVDSFSSLLGGVSQDISGTNRLGIFSGLASSLGISSGSSGSGSLGGAGNLGSSLLQSLGLGQTQTFDASSLTAANGFTASASAGLSDSAVDLGLGFARGGVFTGGRLMAFAGGGVLSSPTYLPMAGGTALAGEAGTEAIMPLTRDASGRLGVSGGGGVNFSPSVQINLNSPGGDQNQNKDLASQVATHVQSQLTTFVQTQLRNETRPGGVIYNAIRS